MKNFDRFIEVVKKYAEAYKDFEEIQMKRLMLTMVLVLAAGMVFAGGISEENARNEYDKRGFVDRPDWAYTFNSIAVKVADGTKFVIGEKSSVMGVDYEKQQFDSNCVRYKVLLDIGVERNFIDDRTRKQQIDKLVAEREKVSKYLAQQSSGLGL